MSIFKPKKSLVLNPDLAKAIGINQAIVLQQMHYWLIKSAITNDGQKWVYNTYNGWQDQFPFFSEHQLKRIITELKSADLIHVSQLNKSRCDRTNYYTINYENPLLDSVCSADLHPSNSADLHSSNRADLHPSNSADLHSSNSADLHSSYTEITYIDYIQEITTEITTEITANIKSKTARENSHAQNFSGEPDFALEKIEQANSEQGEAEKPAKPKKPKNTLDANWLTETYGVNPQIAQDWLTVRKAKKSPLTQTAMDQIQREAEKAKISVAKAVEFACVQNWVGFKADWYANRVMQTATVTTATAATNGRPMPREANIGETADERKERLRQLAEYHQQREEAGLNPWAQERPIKDITEAPQHFENSL